MVPTARHFPFGIVSEKAADRNIPEWDCCGEAVE
jgi:hypothetical protein